MIFREEPVQSEAQLMQITDTLGSLRSRLGLRNRGEQKGSEDTNDGNDDQKLDQRECGRVAVRQVPPGAYNLSADARTIILTPDPIASC